MRHKGHDVAMGPGCQMRRAHAVFAAGPNVTAASRMPVDRNGRFDGVGA